MQQRGALVKKKKNLLGMNLCVILKKKRNKCVNPAYSPRRVKQELILYGSDAAARTVLGEKDQIKASWHFKFY